MISIDASELKNLDTRFRANLINCLTGIKSALLMGTHNDLGETNLAIFSQVLHVGANPPLMGVLFRPETVERHSLSNLRKTGYFTLNHIQEAMIAQAHHSSAAWEQSEFEAVGFHSEYVESIAAPFVANANIQIGLKLEKEYPIDLNGTNLVVGSVQIIRMKSDYILQDGFVDITAAGSIACNGLDAYYKPDFLARLSYARPNEAPTELPGKKTT